VAQSLASFNPKEVLNFIHSLLPDSLLTNYGLATTQTENVTHVGEIVPRLINLETDNLFSACHHRFNEAFTKGTGHKVFQYCFDRGSQFNGPLKGIAHHAIDLEYTLGNFIPGFPDKVDVELSEKLMGYWIEFANGTEPWSDYKTGKALHIKPDGTTELIPRENISSRRWTAYGEIDKNWTNTRTVANALASGNLKISKL
jgi:carboxylesterase type B